MKLEERVRELRLSGGLTLKDLAAQSGLSISYLSDIERGRTTPSINTIESLAKAFNLSVADLLMSVDFVGEQTAAGLPPSLRELIEDDEFNIELDEHWISLLNKIELRGSRPQSKREWMELYLHLRRILGNG
jgi:transcriptional regulator with XRE-family HTH domain